MSLSNSPTARCDRCQTELAPSLFSCPTCGRLIHAERLKMLAKEAQTATEGNDGQKAMSFWQEALTLLPPASEQYKSVQQLISNLENTSKSAERSSSIPVAIKAHPHGDSEKKAAGLGVLGLALWKFKLFIIFLLTKGKLLLLGLTKMSTLLSMLLSVGVYWTAYGWRFAIGLVVSIYIHEMGHVACLRRYGVKADAPMFIPGIGAFVQIKQSFDNPHQDAQTGLAGPQSGLVTALLAYGVSRAMHWPSWAAIAKVGAWINLFNLAPFWQLDGSRGFNALSKSERIAILGITLSLWLVTKEGMLLFIVLMGSFRTFGEKGTDADDQSIFSQYVFLLLALTALTKFL